MAFLTLLRKRLLGLLLVVFGVSLITFAISHLIPGDPARLIAGDRASDALVAGIRHQLGLDLPLYQQYGRYLMDLVQGDLGTSIRTSRPVLEDLQTFFPATLELALVALVLAILAGVPLGVLSAVYHNRAIDQIARTLAVTGISTPAFWLGLGAIVLFYGHLGWLPGGGRLSEGLAPPPTISGFYLLDSLLAGEGALFLDAVEHLLLPAATLGFVTLGVVARQIRSAMLDQLGEDYIRTARAYGLSRWTVILRHALPNALIPSVTVLGLTLGDLLYGAVLTETVFAWPGIGRLAFDALIQRDYSVLLGVFFVASLIVVVVNLVTDILYTVADPRIELK